MTALLHIVNGKTVISTWPPRPCSMCERATALGVVVTEEIEPGGLVYRFLCVECEEE